MFALADSSHGIGRYCDPCPLPHPLHVAVDAQPSHFLHLLATGELGRLDQVGGVERSWTM